MQQCYRSGGHAWTYSICIAAGSREWNAMERNGDWNERMRCKGHKSCHEAFS